MIRVDQISQVSFASGSLRQLLDITYDERLESTGTVDDVEGKLYNFIPPDYTKSATTFADVVDADALDFRPVGEKLRSYIRPAAAAKPKGKGKGKGKANGAAALEELSEDSEGAVVFEVYKVICPHVVVHPLGLTVLGDMGNPWVPRISPADAAVHIALYRGWQLRPCEHHLPSSSVGRMI